MISSLINCVPKLPTLLLLGAILPLSSLHAASFDCAKVDSVPEYLICNTPELSRKDDELKILFDKAKAASQDQSAFRQQAREQWNYRQKNCRDITCLNQWFEEQKSRYEGILTSQTRGASTSGTRGNSTMPLGRSPAPGSIGHTMLRNVQDMQAQCSDNKLSHAEKSWCYSALSAYAEAAAYWNFVHNPPDGTKPSPDAYQQRVTATKTLCRQQNSGGNWADVNIPACEVSAALDLMGANAERVASTQNSAFRPPTPEQTQPAPKQNAPASTPLGAPVEPDSRARDLVALSLDVVDSAIQLIKANGYRCDTISAARAMSLTRGLIVVCNRYAYKYELKDRGGNWVVTVD